MEFDHDHSLKQYFVFCFCCLGMLQSTIVFHVSALSRRLLVSTVQPNLCQAPCGGGEHGFECEALMYVVSVCMNYIISVNPFTPELKKCILPTFQKAIVRVM